MQFLPGITKHTMDTCHKSLNTHRAVLLGNVLIPRMFYQGVLFILETYHGVPNYAGQTYQKVFKHTGMTDMGVSKYPGVLIRESLNTLEIDILSIRECLNTLEIDILSIRECLNAMWSLTKKYLNAHNFDIKNGRNMNVW